MKLATTSFIEHRTQGEQALLSRAGMVAQLLVPGASTSCWGSSSTSTCCGVVTPGA
jgi:hypothetical protein